MPVNLPAARKVDKIKSIPLRKLTKQTGQQNPLKASLPEILTNFEAAVCEADSGRLRVDNHATAKGIRELLSALQSLLKRNESFTSNEEQFEEITALAVKSLSTLNRVVSDESGFFPETITLSALCMTFILLNYFTSFPSKLQQNTVSSGFAIPGNGHVWISCHLYSSYFSAQTDLETTALISAFNLLSDLGSDHISTTLTTTIKRMSSTEQTTAVALSFREVALINGLLACQAFHELLTTEQQLLQAFLLLHPLTLRLCSAVTVYEFHIVRLLNTYLRALYSRRKTIEAYVCSQKEQQQSYEQLLVELISGTLAQIDHDWESQVHGVANLIRDAYKCLIELAKEPAIQGGSVLLRQLIAEQFSQALSLPFTCKSKYRKLSTLLQCLASEPVDAWYPSSASLQTPVASAEAAKLCELPFLLGEPDNFAQQVVHHLSINTLTNSVTEFYKVSVGAIVAAYKDCTAAVEEKESGSELNKVTAVWCACWLKALTGIFASSATTTATSAQSTSLSQSSIVQCALVSQLLPFTLQHIPGSMAILMEAFHRHPFGQIAVVRLCLERCSASVEADSLPPSSWLLELLADGDERTRAEALALLVDERLIGRGEGGGGGNRARQAARPLVCRLVVRHFLRSNLNIDSASFRQRVICRVEAFYAKVITSVVDRFGRDGNGREELKKLELKELPATERAVVHCVKETLDLLAVSLVPGACYQRKFTALSLFSAIIGTLEREDREDVFARLFCQTISDSEKSPASPEVSWISLLLLGLVDKDDKIRRLSTEVLIELGSSRLFAYLTLHLSNLRPPKLLEQIQSLTLLFANSPRHQETHLSGLLVKLPHRWALNGKEAGQRRQAMQALFWATKRKVEEVAVDFYSERTRSDLLWTARSRPLHGVLLQLNHLLPLLAFSEVLIAEKRGKKKDEDEEDDVSRDRLAFLRALLQPCIKLTLDVIEFFVVLLTPKSNNSNESIDDDGEEEDPMDASSPSFLEMGQAIEEIIRKGRADTDKSKNNSTDHDVSTSNDFQLLMSLCWLNIKECTFLLTTITALFADLLSLVTEPFLVTAEELLAMGSKIVSVMLRCRHKGVIEASGVALSRYTRTLLRIQSTASRTAAGPATRELLEALEAFVGRILAAIDFSKGDDSSNSSITRRSAGLALIIQSVLVGEAEAIDVDGLRPIIGSGGGGSGTFSNSTTLYERVINLLVSVATTPVSPDGQNQDHDQAKQQVLVDLPQANALHILQALVGTSALGAHTAKTVERLFPLCVAGFTSPHWPLRNASLTLFGACTTRMLGQKKWIRGLEVARTEGSERSGSSSVEGEHLGAGYIATITFAEFASRYPSLVGVIEGHFAGCQQKSSTSKGLHPELHHLPSYLTAFLLNRIWKVRMLAARALATLWSTGQLEDYLFERLQLNKYGEATARLSGNAAHGLLCLADNVLQLKERAFTPDMNFYRQRLSRLFSGILMGRENILSEIGLSVMHPADFGSEVLSSDVLPEEEERGNPSASGSTLRQSDDIRLKAAEQLRAALRVPEEKPEEAQQELLLTGGANLATLVDILLVLLEDEDRAVRGVGQAAVGLLVHRLDLLAAFPLYRTRPVLSQTASLDCLFSLISHHLHAHPRQPLSAEAEEPLFAVLLRRLFTSSRLAREDTAELTAMMERNEAALLSGRKEEEAEEVIVLFEREQKNVFAEPYAMAIRIGAYLAATAHRHFPLVIEELEGEEGNRLAKSCQRLSDLLESKGPLLLQTLMGLSIWKLPDFYGRMVSLSEVLMVLEVLSSDDILLKWWFLASEGRCLGMIRHHFPYLETLKRQVLKAPEDDSLLAGN
ncbi:hypothetical protein TYRP_001049 [Tyrophagus putrescentiae]|nr:hypothetical protein TYRP_001049 [Tyrophagus putrescentiae]